jgi:tetratricopeptide (TPR) repeat protein
MVSITSEEPSINLAQASILLKEGKLDAAILHAYRTQGIYTPSSGEWLILLSRKNFKAVVAYSLHLQSTGELIDYFLEMLDFHLGLTFFIYHNLAVRLFFEGNPELALKYLEIALENSVHATSLILKSMIHRKLEQTSLAQEALQQAHALDENISIEEVDFTQSQLLITPKT